jgi:hypothetical protein
LLIPLRGRDRLAPAQDPHRLEHRLPRLRRAAGDDGDRAGDGRDRGASRPRSAECRQANLYGPGRDSRPIT